MREDHRWSGWPGAWCLDCGIPDMREVCLAEGHPDGCEICENPVCTAPGQANYDPYTEKEVRE